MIKILKIFILLFPMSLSAQNNSIDSIFTLDMRGLTDYVVVKTPNKTSADLFKKTMEWVSVTYKNPKDVILSQIENEYIRIEGFTECLYKYPLLGTSLFMKSKYQIEISFKNGKYKFDVITIEVFAPPSNYSKGDWVNLSDEQLKNMFEKNGKVKKPFRNAEISIPFVFNEINNSLHSYINSNEIPSKKDDW